MIDFLVRKKLIKTLNHTFSQFASITRDKKSLTKSFSLISGFRQGFFSQNNLVLKKILKRMSTFFLNLLDLMDFFYYFLVMIALDMSTHLFSKLFKKEEPFARGALGIDFVEVASCLVHPRNFHFVLPTLPQIGTKQLYI